jgi:hypothetical protein
MSNRISNEINFPKNKLNIGKFKIIEEEFDLRLRSNSCIIPFDYCLEFVPKLK